MGTTTIQRQLSLPGESAMWSYLVFSETYTEIISVKYFKSCSILFSPDTLKRYAEDLGCLPAVPWPTFMDGVQANAFISKATEISRKQDSSLSWLHIEPPRLEEDQNPQYGFELIVHFPTVFFGIWKLPTTCDQGFSCVIHSGCLGGGELVACAAKYGHDYPFGPDR